MLSLILMNSFGDAGMKGKIDSEVTGRFENVIRIEVDETQTHIYLISGNDLWILGGHEEWGAFFRK